jgi:hypothetical protein
VVFGVGLDAVAKTKNLYPAGNITSVVQPIALSYID